MSSRLHLFRGERRVHRCCDFVQQRGNRFGRFWSTAIFGLFPTIWLALESRAQFPGSTACSNWETSLLFVPAIYVIYRSYRLYLGKLEDEKRHVEEIANLHLRTIEALALAIEAKDQTTHDHLQRVRVYAIEVAKELGMKGAELEALARRRFAA